MKLVIASTNMHKIREFRSMLKSLKTVDIYSLVDFPHYVPPYEDGRTFEENATLKAEHAAKALGCWTIADDSGLVVPALKGDPGVYSARYAGPSATDKENCQKLLLAMKDLHDTDRCAYLECCIVLASPKGVEKQVKAICEGMIDNKESGRNGFGYDTVFRKYEYSKTFADLEEETKNRISHRRKAFDKILISLESIRDNALLDRRL